MNSPRWLCLATTLSAFIFGLPAWAQTNTNSPSSVYIAPYPLKKAGVSADDFRLRFEQEITQNGTEIYSDSFGYPSVLKLALHRAADGYKFHDFIDSRGYRVFVDTGLDSLRETAVACSFLRDRIDAISSAEFIENLLAGSIADTAEERIVLASPTLTETEVRRTWLERLSAGGSIRYGIKPWLTSPYIFVGKSIGSDNERPLAILDFRAYSLLRNHNAGLVKLQMRGTVPLTPWSQVVLGLNAYPTDFNSEGHGPFASLGYGILLGKKGDQVLYFGSRVGDGDRRAEIELALKW